MSPLDAALEPVASLSERQRRVAELVAEGRSNREIAGELDASVSLVKLELRIVCEKWGVSERTQVAAIVGRLSA